MAATIPTNGLGVDAGLDIAGGNLTFTTADKGVHLGVTSANAVNLIHDYEEGTWTPAFATGFYAENGYQVQSGKYVKIGNTVICQYYLYTASSGWTSNGNQISISGLPFTSGATLRAFGGVGYSTMMAKNPQVYSGQNSTTLFFYVDGDDDFTRGSNHTGGSSMFVIGGCVYTI